MQPLAFAEGGEKAVDWMDHVGCYVAAQLDIPLVVVDARLALMWANGAARSRRGSAWATLLDGKTPPYDTFELRRQLHALVLACLRQQSPSEALVEGQDGTWFATAVPLHGNSGPVLLRLVAMHQACAGVCDRLRRLFGLTQAEAQITAQLASGCSVECIADERGVSVDTVRAQMRSIFQKTGLHRQGELICAVGKLAAG